MLIMVAGSDTRGSEECCYNHNVPKLYSMLNERKQIDNWNDDYFLMVDSGAHSWNKAAMTPIGMKRKTKLKPAGEFIEEYFQYIKDNRHRKLVFVEFDVYLDLPKEQIDKMYYDVQALDGLVAKFCRVYHPTLDNATFTTLQQWVDEGQEYILIANDSLPYLDAIFNITRDKVKVHGLAMTKTGLIEKYPFFSVDSTSPLSTVIFGRYSRPIMAFNEREDIFKARSIECYDDDWQRLEKAILETKETQNYITELWLKKGVKWEDLKF